MRIWCYGVDRGGWGQRIEQAAIRRGHEAYVFKEISDEMLPGDYVFMRVPQWEPELIEGKNIATELHYRGCKLIPDLTTILLYEDKVMQRTAYTTWMPTTRLIREPDSWNEARQAAEEVGFPFISKAKEASASVNCRIVNNMAEARAEYHKSIVGDGIDIAIGKGRRGRQKGYLLWQKFLQRNPCDYRVVIVGRYMMMLRRENKPGTPFASGSGVNSPVTQPTAAEAAALIKAREFFTCMELKWNGIDLVYDWDEKDWKILETTLGWSQDAYKDCVFFSTDYKGEDIFELLLDEIEEGEFG